jgi:hypothetical protein
MVASRGMLSGIYNAEFAEIMIAVIDSPWRK